MLNFFWAVYGAVLLQRLAELRLAHRHGLRIRQRGGYEVGADHYKYIVLLHAGFLAAWPAEVLLRADVLPRLWWLPFSLFAAAQALRVWCIRSLGVHWNTRIYVLPGMAPVRRGPYRRMRHPNYAVVTLELLTLPLAFGAYLTAAVIGVGNVLVLRHRIAVEEAALAAVSSEADAGSPVTPAAEGGPA